MTSIPRPLFKQQGTAAMVGVVLWAAGLYCLHDAWRRRGERPPFLVRLLASPPPFPGK